MSDLGILFVRCSLKQSKSNSRSSSVSPRAELWWAGCIYLVTSVGVSLLLSGYSRIGGVQTLGLVLTLISMAAQIWLTHSLSGALGHIAVLATFAFLGGTPYVSGLFGSLLSACCSFCVFCRRGGGVFAPALPILAYGLSALLLWNPISAALTLAVLPPALMLWLCLRTRTNRIPAVCRMSVTLLAVTLPMIGVFLHRRLGSLSLTAFRLFLEEIRLGATGAIGESVVISGLPLGTNADAASYVDTLVTALFNVLPALIVILAMLVAFGIHSAALRCLIGQGEDEKSLKKMISFDMSLTSALLYFAAMLLSVILVSEQTALFGAVAQNLYLILAPGMLMTAWIAMNALLFAKAPSCFSTVLYLGVMLLTFNFPSVMLPLAAAFGAGVVILGRLRLRKNQNKS